MNRDTMVLGLLVCMPLGVAVLFALMIRLSRRIQSRECPHCHCRISKDAFKHAVPCPECGAALEELNPEPPPIPSNLACHQCGSGTSFVRLWDNEAYCETCILKCSRRLWTAAGQTHLAEVMPYSLRAIAWRAFLFAAVSLTGFAVAIAVLVGAASGDWRFGFQGVEVILIIGSPVTLLFTGAATVIVAVSRLKVAAWNGRLIVRDGMRLSVAPLRECTWRSGTRSQMTIHQYAFLLLGPALIVELPRNVMKEGNRVAVGFTDETREVWQSFFELASVPRAAEVGRGWLWKRTQAQSGTVE